MVRMKILCPKCKTEMEVNFGEDYVVCPVCQTTYKIKVEITLEELKVERYEKKGKRYEKIQVRESKEDL